MDSSAPTSVSSGDGALPHPRQHAVDPPAAADRVPPLRPLDPDDLVTRLLCAGVYLHGAYAVHVVKTLLNPSPRAICPPWGVDAVRLARHAVQAKRLRKERDIHLMYTLGAVLCGGVAVLALLLFDGLPLAIALTEWGLLWLAGYGVAFALVFRQYRTARRTAVSLAYDPDPPEAPPLTDARLEVRLDDLHDANTVVFARNHMFVGSGRLLDQATMIVDIGKGTTRDDGTRRKPKRFDGLDLHRELLETVPKGMKPKPLAGHRLYVRGGFTIHLPIFPHGPVDGDLPEEIAFRRPVNHVPPELLEHFLRQPDDAARVYSVFEQRGWGGRVAVTIFVRSKVVGRTLFVEVYSLAQQQLRSAFTDVTTIRMQGSDEIPALLRSVLPVAMPLLMGSARRRWRSHRSLGREARDLRDVARSIARHREIDFGASSSIREDSSGEGVGSNDLFPWVDEDMYYQVLSARVLDCIKDFLVRKDVDTSSFERQQITLVENTMIKARDIYGSALNKGVNKSTRTTKSNGGGGRGDSGGD